MAYKIIQTKSYLKIAAKFFKKHPELLKKYGKAITLLTDNPYHPSLRLHKLQGKHQEYFSVSIDMSYRLVIDLVIDDKEITPINIGTHDEVYS